MAVVRTKLAVPVLPAMPVRVYTATTLPDYDAGDELAGWTARPTLYCDSLRRPLSGVSQASFSFAFGTVAPLGGGPFGTVGPLQVLGQFVRVRWRPYDPTEADQADAPWSEWVGYFADGSYQRGGGAIDVVKVGNQSLTAVGLEWFLDRAQVHDAVLLARPENPAGSPTNAGYVRIQRPMVFNDPAEGSSSSGQRPRGNRSGGTTFDPPAFDNRAIAAGLYAAGGATPVEWDGVAIVRYLLHHHTPTGAPSVSPAEPTANVRWDNRAWRPCQFQLVGSEPLASTRPTIATAGQTVLSLIQQVANPRRGLGVTFDYDFVNKRVDVRGVSMAASSVTLSDGASLPANGNPIDLLFDDDPMVNGCQVRRPLQQRYTRFRVRGARMTSTFTLGIADGTLAKAWSDTEETAYEAATDEAREEFVHSRAFALFEVPGNWDGTTADGAAGSTRYSAFPVLSPTGSVLGSLPVYPPAMRLLPRTRLRRGAASAPRDEFEPPRVMFTSSGSLVYADAMPDGVASYSLYEGDHGLAVRVRGTGSLPHTLGDGTFSGASEVATEVDYRTMRLTVAAEADAYCEGVVETTPPVGMPVEELVIDAGPSYRLDFLARDTVIGINGAGEAVKATAAVLRDDRKRLVDMAKLAELFYRQQPAQMAVGFRRIANLAPLGALVTSIGEGTAVESIGAVVAAVEYDFSATTMRIETAGQGIGFGEGLA
jgi:putative component of toxin-antitoxin plasmid stabilization module